MKAMVWQPHRTATTTTRHDVEAKVSNKHLHQICFAPGVNVINIFFVTPASFSFIISLFKQIINFFQQINMKNVQMSIQYITKIRTHNLSKLCVTHNHQTRAPGRGDKLYQRKMLHFSNFQAQICSESVYYFYYGLFLIPVKVEICIFQPKRLYKIDRRAETELSFSPMLSFEYYHQQYSPQKIFSIIFGLLALTRQS